MNAMDSDVKSVMAAIGQRARAAARVLAYAATDAKNLALSAAADAIIAETPAILAANAEDIAAAKERGISNAFLDRLTLTDTRIAAIAQGLVDIAALPDPVGTTTANWQRPNGLDISRVRTPLGVIGVIFESRPNVTADAGALTLKSGNAVILRGGSDSVRTSVPVATSTGTEGARMSDIVKHLDKAYRDLARWMVKHPREVIQQRQEFSSQLLKKRCVYGDATMKTTLMPMFLKPKSLELISKVAMELDRIVDKVVNLYFEDSSIREYFPFHDVPKEWIEHDPGYKKPTVINRLDALYDGKNLKFIEFNADNPGGRGWTDTYEDIYRFHPLYKDLIGDYGTTADRPVTQGLWTAIRNCMGESLGIDPTGPVPSGTRMAIATFRGSGSHGDEEIVRDYFIERGFEANLIDPRDMELKRGQLHSNGVRFNVVLRSMKAQFYLRYPREIRDFVKGITSNAACMVNSFRALLGSEKAILSFLTNPLTQDKLTDEERKTIRRYVPWTRKLDETITLSKDGNEVDLREFILTHKDELVLKPSWGAGGAGVMVGKSATQEAWSDAVSENMGAPWWTVQEYVEIPQITLPVIKKGKVVLEKKFLNLSPYVFGGQYVGVLGRVSDRDVINVSAGGGLIPVFPIRAGATVPEDPAATLAAPIEIPESIPLPAPVKEPAKDTASAKPASKSATAKSGKGAAKKSR